MILFVLLFSIAFLIYPLEYYLLEMKRKILTTITIIVVPIPIILRIVEYILDVNLSLSSPLYLTFIILWYCVIGVIAVSILILIILYIRIALGAPKGSPAFKKSLAIIFGFLVWLIIIFGTPKILKEILTFDPVSYEYLFPFIIPALLAISLKLIIYGYTTE